MNEEGKISVVCFQTTTPAYRAHFLLRFLTAPDISILSANGFQTVTTHSDNRGRKTAKKNLWNCLKKALAQVICLWRILSLLDGIPTGKRPDGLTSPLAFLKDNLG